MAYQNTGLRSIKTRDYGQAARFPRHGLTYAAASLRLFALPYAPIDRHVEQGIRPQVQQEQRGDAANRKEEVVERYVLKVPE